MTKDVHAGLYRRLAEEGVEAVGELQPLQAFDALGAVLRQAYGAAGRVRAELLPAEERTIA